MKEDSESLLVDYFYRSSFANIIIGFICSIIYFVYYQHDIANAILWTWFGIVIFSLVLNIVLLSLYRVFFKNHTSMWFGLYGCVMVVYALAWGLSILFIHPDSVNPYLTLSVLPVIAAILTATTIGSFKLFAITVPVTLIPLTIWCFLQQNHLYSVSSEFLLLYLVLLIMINYRASHYLKKTIELSLKNEHYVFQANHDILTNLPNQRLLLRLLEENILLAKQKNEPFALICFEINNVENYNSALGYQGDIIIQIIAKSLDSLLKAKRLEDNITRIVTLPRSDVFAIIINPINTPQLTTEIQSLFKALDLPFRALKEDKKITASVGVSIYDNEPINGRRLLKNAFAALLKAKLKEPNHIEFYNIAESPTPLKTAFALEEDLLSALKNNEFELNYQPIINLRSGKVDGVEALIRWHHKTKGLISPLDFIPIAEKTGLILEIGEWILERAAQQILEWHQQGFENLSLKVGVNLSVQQLRRGNLIDTLDRMMRKTGLEAKYLDLEVTEATLLDEELIPLIHLISKKGISLSLDDFGTGFSSLNYLKKFNISTIKIDKSLIQKVLVNNETAVIVSAILAMAKELGINTLAEGVETETQLAFLEERDCLLVQGYYFCKPLNADKFTRLLSSHLKFFNKNQAA